MNETDFFIVTDFIPNIEKKYKIGVIVFVFLKKYYLFLVNHIISQALNWQLAKSSWQFCSLPTANF